MGIRYFISRIKQAKTNFLSEFTFLFNLFRTDMKGDANVNKIIGISVGLVVASVMIPLGVNRVLQAENASWGILGTMFTVLLPLLAILAIVLMFLRK